jgi:alkanesulfonate monooxygenase SsuD/methylene tetrahydromethanopterin reductase-like flavin-dependent oxidoreductase (luciferase family)
VTVEETASYLKAAEEGKDVAELITDKAIQALCVVGNTESCIRQIQEIVNAGANTPVAFPVPGTDPIALANLIGEKIAPHLT